MLLNSCDRILSWVRMNCSSCIAVVQPSLGNRVVSMCFGCLSTMYFPVGNTKRLSTYNRVRMTTQAAKLAICFKHLYMLMEYAPHTSPVKGWLPSVSFKLGMQFIISSHCPVCVCVCMYVCVYTLADARVFSKLSYGVLWLPTLACQCDFHS